MKSPSISVKCFYSPCNSAILILWLLLFTTVWFIAGCGPRWQITPLEPAPAAVTASNGMVVAAHPLAAEAGVSVLREGGNAVDAAIAALFMLNVVEPHASGLGGGGFAMVRTADGEAKVVIYRERAPGHINPVYYSDPVDSLHLRLITGATSVCVPGAASGWAELYDNWHTMPLERLARDAIKTAEEGFQVDPTLAGQIANNFEKISTDSLLALTFLKKLDAGEADDNASLDDSAAAEEVRIPYEVGDIIRQPELAATFRSLVKRGLRSFYRGPVAESIVAAVNAGGGAMSLEDLEFYRCELTDPVSGEYGDYEVLSIPPPSRGGVALIEALNLFKVTDATRFGVGDPQSIHLMSQCLQQAYTDARFRVCDQSFISTDWRQMLTSEHAALAADGINLDAKAGAAFPLGLPKKEDHGNTTHLVVVDRRGNVVSLTQSINYFFGAGVMAGGTGLLLNNQMADFSLPPTDDLSPIPLDTLNYIQKRKRPRSNMTPVIILKDGKPVLIIGTPGGSRIVAAMAQIIVNIVDYNLDIATAIDYPRFFPVMEHIVLENRVDKKSLKYLRKAGYQIHLAGPYSTYFGGAHGIMLPPLGRQICGAADKRRGGAARGY